MVLMKLQLNLGCQDLLLLWYITQLCRDTSISGWMYCTNNRSSMFVSWPEREQLLKTIPLKFQNNFRKCATVMTAFRSLLYFNCKGSNLVKHNTVKFLNWHHSMHFYLHLFS